MMNANTTSKQEVKDFANEIEAKELLEFVEKGGLTKLIDLRTILFEKTATLNKQSMFYLLVSFPFILSFLLMTASGPINTRITIALSSLILGLTALVLFIVATKTKNGGSKYPTKIRKEYMDACEDFKTLIEEYPSLNIYTKYEKPFITLPERPVFEIEKFENDYNIANIKSNMIYHT